MIKVARPRNDERKRRMFGGRDKKKRMRIELGGMVSADRLPFSSPTVIIICYTYIYTHKNGLYDAPERSMIQTCHLIAGCLNSRGTNSTKKNSAKNCMI